MADGSFTRVAGHSLDNFLHLVKAERERQIQKGYSAEFDDEHTDDELAECAGKILMGNDAGHGWIANRAKNVLRKYANDRKRQLVIAAALIAAEYERLFRQVSQSPEARALQKIRRLLRKAGETSKTATGVAISDDVFDKLCTLARGYPE